MRRRTKSIREEILETVSNTMGLDKALKLLSSYSWLLRELTTTFQVHIYLFSVWSRARNLSIVFLSLRYAHVNWFLFLMGPLCSLGGRWASKSNHNKDTCLKDIGLGLQILTSTTYSTMTTTGRIHVFFFKVHKSALSITITKSWEVRFLSIFHCIFTNVTKFVLSKPNW